MLASPGASGAPAFSTIIDQDVPTIYFEVARAKYSEFHNSVLQSILAARLHVDILTSERGYMSVHRQSAYAEAESDLLERGAQLKAAGGDAAAAAAASPFSALGGVLGGGPEAALLVPPGVGPVLVRITATEARLLEEAERAEFKLPLNPEVLRRVDIERNRVERYPGCGAGLGADRLAIPHKFGSSGVMGSDAHGMDPYAYHHAAFLYKKQLPEATRAALRAAGYNTHLGLDDPEQARILFDHRGTDGRSLLSEMSSLKLLASVLTAPNSPDEDGEWQGANFDLTQLEVSGKVESIFAGHCYASREAVVEVAARASWDLRSFGIGSIFHHVAQKVKSTADAAAGGGSSSAAAARASGRSLASSAEAPGSAARSPRERRSHLLLTSMTGVSPDAPPEIDAHGQPRFVRPSEYMRAYFGESIGMYFAFAEFYQSSMAFLCLCGVGVFAYQRYLNTVEVNVLPAYALTAALWSVLFQLSWRRRQSQTVMRWGMTDFSVKEPIRPSYAAAQHTVKARGPLDGRITWVADPRVQAYRLTLSYGVTFLAMVGAIIVCFLVFYGRLLLSALLNSTGDYLTTLINNVWIGTGNTLWTFAARSLTGWENKPTVSSFDVSFVFKSSLFRILNTYISLFYIALQIKNFVRLGKESDQCALRYNGVLATEAQLAAAAAGLIPPPVSDCITELYEQLTIQMATNWIFSVCFVHLIGPVLAFLKRLQISAGKDANQLDLPTLKRAEAAVKEATEMVLNGERNLCASPQELWLRVLVEANNSSLNFVELYMITLLQFGYVALFSPAFPLAGTVAVISNAAGIRVDTWAVFRHSKRPIPMGAQDIGAWSSLFLFVSCLAVLTNCAVITITTTQPLFSLSLLYDNYISPGTLKCVAGGVGKPVLRVQAPPARARACAWTLTTLSCPYTPLCT